MAIYSVAITPLFQRVNDSGTKQVWFADDAAGSCMLKKLRLWWDALARPGPAFGYLVNGEKTWLVTKEQLLLFVAASLADGLICPGQYRV